MRTQCTIIAAALLTGCASDLTNPKHARENAAAVVPQVSELRMNRKTELDQINARYQANFANIMKNLAETSRLDADLQNYGAAQNSADAIQFDWPKRTLKSELHVLMARDLEAEVERLDAMYRSLAAARSIYAESYKEAALALDKLKKVESGLNDLARPGRMSKGMVQILKAVVEAAKKASEEKNK